MSTDVMPVSLRSTDRLADTRAWFVHNDPFIVTAWYAEPEHEQGQHDPRSIYAELFWLPVVGPSCLWMMRRLTSMLRAYPPGRQIGVADLAGMIGLAHNGGSNSPAVKTLARLCSFGMIRTQRDNRLQVKRLLPYIPEAKLAQLPVVLQDVHEKPLAWGGPGPVGSA